jgi:hypothetical protein
MNNPSQRPQPAEPDMVLLFLGSFLEDLLHAPVRDDAKVDALAMQILDEGPKTLLGLVIRFRVEKWLRRHLWTLAFDSLSPLDQGVRVVIDSAMRIDCDRRATHCSAGSGPENKIIKALPSSSLPFAGHIASSNAASASVRPTHPA